MTHTFQHSCHDVVPFHTETRLTFYTHYPTERGRSNTMPVPASAFKRNDSFYFLFLGSFTVEIPESCFKMSGYPDEGTMWRGHVGRNRGPADPSS